jgi:hypothetical protein
MDPLTVAINSAPEPLVPELFTTTVGGVEYPDPPTKLVTPVTAPPDIVAVAEAPEPPPPVKVKYLVPDELDVISKRFAA